MGLLQPLLSLCLGAICSLRGEASLRCPGEIKMRGYGPVSLVNAKWNTPKEKAEMVYVSNGRVLPSMKGRTYFADACNDLLFDRTQYLALNLLGKTLSYTIDLSGAGCGCNAALYLTSMHHNPNPSECLDHYCDANHGCGDACAEIDIQGANERAWHSSVSTPSNPSGSKAGYGGGDVFDGPRDWGHGHYAPDSNCINTSAPFQVAASFPIDGRGALTGLVVTLSQGPCRLTTKIENYRGFAELSTAMSAGMTPVISYWSSPDMLWMDGPGTDLKGPCKADKPESCADLVKFYNFSVEVMRVPETTTPAPTTTSTPMPSPVPTRPPPTTTTSGSQTTGGIQAGKPQHGALLVKGNQIVSSETGQPVQLRGMSFFWSQWMGKFWNADVVRWLKSDWRVTVLRCAMGVEQGGYLENPAREKAKLEVVVRAAIAAGIYVLIDWHDYNAHLHVNEAKAFFSEMAQKYGSYPNVLFETFNEPMQIGWADTIKPYHEQIVPVIRQHTNNLIILGTRKWSQCVDEAAWNPVAGVNLAYTIHFYAASMGQELRNKVSSALQKGVPIFATEWGTCEYTGNGALNLGETQAWLDFFKQNHISNINWAISDKTEACSALSAGADKHGGWTKFELTPSGVFVRASLRAEPAVEPMPSLPTTSTTTTPVPLTINPGGAPQHSTSSLTAVVLVVLALATGAVMVVGAVFLTKVRKQPDSLKSKVCCLDTRPPSAQNLLAAGAAQANSPTRAEGM